MNLYHALSSVGFYYIAFFVEGYQQSNVESDRIDNEEYRIHNFHRFMIYPFIDMVTALCMLYLFYELGRRLRNQPHKSGKTGRIEGDGPAVIDNRMNHETKHLKELLAPSLRDSSEEDNTTKNNSRNILLEFNDLEGEEHQLTKGEYD